MRTTLNQVMQSMLPQAIGACSQDVPTVAQYVNRAQQILINAGGETGWFGGWQKVVFQVLRSNPYITLPRQFARVINMDVCRYPIRIQNEFYELLEAGVGLQGFSKCRDWCGALEGYERGVWPSTVDLTPSNQYLAVYVTDPRDVGKRILIGPAKDQNGNYIYSTDGLSTANGFYLTFAQPFTVTNFIVTEFAAIQKDLTYGDVLLYQIDATTGAQVLLSRYAPDEITPAYRRYFINKMPCGCFEGVRQSPCLTNVTTGGTPAPPDPYIPVTAVAKLEFIPVARLTDYLVIGNIPALIEECKALRYSDMDLEKGAALEQKCHGRAIKMLNDELRHYLGELTPAINVAPFGTARLGRVMDAVQTG